MWTSSVVGSVDGATTGKSREHGYLTREREIIAWNAIRPQTRIEYKANWLVYSSKQQYDQLLQIYIPIKFHRFNRIRIP